MSFGNDIRRDVFDQLFLRLQGVLAVRGEAEPFADTEDMGIHRHGGLVPDDGTDNIGSFASYALERLQILDIIGNSTVIGLHQAFRHGYQMFRFGTRVTDGLDIFKHLIAGGISHGLRGGISGKEGRCHHVHALVRTLRGEHHGHQTLEGIGKNQFAFRHRHVGLKPRENVFIAFSNQHSYYYISDG